MPFELILDRPKTLHPPPPFVRRARCPGWSESGPPTADNSTDWWNPVSCLQGSL